MTATTGLVGAVLLFWGWQVGLLPIAGLAALVVEAPAIVTARFDLGARDLRNVPRACAAALVAGAAIAFATGPGGLESTLKTIQWAPLALLPLVLAQRFGAGDRIDLNALTGTVASRPRPVDLSSVYAAACLIAAGAANQRAPWFFFGMVLFAGWALAAVPSPRRARRPVAFVLALALAAGLGYAAQIGLNHLQQWVVEVMVGIIADVDDGTDPYENTTALGRIGTLKLSDSIVLRVVSKDGPPPRYLYRAVYDGYGGGNWLAREAPLEDLRPSGAGSIWQVRPGAAPRAVTVSGQVPGGKGVLSLPAGLVRIDAFPADAVRRNRLGATEAEREPAWYRLEARYDPESAADSPPGDRDLAVPRTEDEVIRQVLAGIAREDASAGTAVAAIERHLATGFEYSLYQPERVVEGTPVADFLLRHRSGHCEYYATSTALLLRAAGVPARYATGYSVGEWSDLEQAWVVRLRHAHAWVRAWVGGRWVDVDTTPSTWVNVEAAEAAWYEPLLDRWSWLVHRFRRWRADDRFGVPVGWLLALLGPAAFVAWRFVRRLRRVRRAVDEAPVASARAGGDSRFFEVTAALARRGLGRAPGERAAQWLARVRAAETGDSSDAVDRMDALHQRLRFDPRGLPAADRHALESEVSGWLGRFGGSPSGAAGEISGE